MTTAPKPPTPTRLYIIRNTAGEPIALIEATTAYSAGRYWMDKNYSVKYAEQNELLAAFKADLTPELAVGEAT